MDIQITIDTSNAAFGPDIVARKREVERILTENADIIGVMQPGDVHSLRDINGNWIGEATANAK